jgi:hypothetical protein
MGGQACILRGAAEFSRDIDLAVAVSPGNLDRLRAALEDLKAEPIFFPPLSAAALSRGHACHFRCGAPGVQGLRIDLMAVMRGLEAFELLWRRRELIPLPGVGSVATMSVMDLVMAKKTQRDKDWPMLRRLVEADIASAREPSLSRRRFWLMECRTPELLCALVRRYPGLARRLANRRRALRAALGGNLAKLAGHLRECATIK